MEGPDRGPAGGAIALREIPTGAADGVAHLTFPWMRAAIARFADRARLVAALDEGFPCGLAAGLAGPNRDFELLSVYVAPLYRRRGIGTALLRRLEAGFTASGARIGQCHLTIDPADQGGARFLMRAGWQRPVVTALICHSTMENAFQTPWLVGARLPQGYRIADWQAVAAAAYGPIKAGLGDWVTPDLDPYDFQDGAHAATSVALLDAGDRVRGWVITHCIGCDTLRWTCSFVDPRVEGRARIVPLWLECARRQRALEGPQNFTFTVPVEKPRMAKFAVRRMRPWLTRLMCAATTLKRMPDAR